MANKIRELCIKLQNQLVLYETIRQELQPNLPDSKMQNIRLRLTSSKARIYQLKHELKNTINSPIWMVTYVIGNSPTHVHAKIANMNKEEIESTLKLYIKLKGYDPLKLRIIEIKEIRTYLSDIEL